MVLDWMHGIAAGVSHLHDNGIVHRDLKPGNIFLDGHTVKIGDYGLSKFISCSRRSGQTESVGTVHYMAPEIANGRYGREIDTYALGIILYEMLTGHVPFEGESVGEVLMKHLTAEPDLSAVEEPYREIIRRALAKDPDVRLRSVGEMVNLLPGATLQTGGQWAVQDAPPIGVSPTTAADPHPAAPPLDASAPLSSDPRQTRRNEDEEPIYRAVSDGWRNFWDRWHASQMHPLFKALLLVGGGFCVLLSGLVTVPAILSMLCLYLIYYCVWSLFIRPNIRTHSVNFEPQHQPGAGLAGNPAGPGRPGAQRAPAQPRVGRHSKAAERRRRRLNWREQAHKELLAKPWRARMTELIGSMLIASGVCVAGSVIIAGMLTGLTGSSAAHVSIWFSIVSTLCTWAVLVTNKFTEGSVEDQIPMRGTLLVLGALVGLIAGGLSLSMPVGLPNDRDFGPGLNDSLMHEMFNFPGYHDTQRGRNVIGQGAIANVSLSVAYFAFLMMALRWWRQAEYTREKRLSLWPIFLCVIGAWLLHLVWWYPQPAGMAVAVIVGFATQLSSPWLRPSRRNQMARGNAA